MEQRAYGWYHYYKSQASPDLAPFLSLNKSISGTGHGLSMLPYLRESRRSRVGVDDFRLLYHRDLNASNPADQGKTSRNFYDTCAIGDYHYADIHGLDLKGGACAGLTNYPEYLLHQFPLKPYYVPFRALTNAKLSNILTPGKSMAQSFLANAATRLHPTEWSTGVAAGAAAYMLAENFGWNSTKDVLAHIEDLQTLLKSEAVRSPLQWQFE